MARSGFVPAWMTIPKSDLRSRTRHHSSDLVSIDRRETNPGTSKVRQDRLRSPTKNVTSSEEKRTASVNPPRLSEPEEKQLLLRMGWKESDDRNYEITDQDKEEYEKRLQLSPRSEQNSATLLFALRRRTLPSLDLIEELLRVEAVVSDEDDSSA